MDWYVRQMAWSAGVRLAMPRKIIYYVHWLLFLLFVATAIGAFVAWQLTESLGTAGLVATGAAFFATASGFLERLFPEGRDE